MTPPNRLAQSSSGAIGAAKTPALQPSSTPFRPPAPTIPDYEVVKRIGGGSYGDVWLVRSLLGSYRAAKVVYRKSFEQDQPFEREFKGIQRFEPISHLHQSQVKILHVGRNYEAGCFYYVMELADDAGENPKGEWRNPKETQMANDANAECGLQSAEFSSRAPSAIPQSAFCTPQSYTARTLKLDLQRRGRIPVEECIRIGVWLSTALAHLHGHGLIHRDVKPSNIIFVNGVPKLADIGLVTDVEATRSFVGTEGFIPPEGPGTPQADLYSLGKVLYEMSMGRSRLDFPALAANWDELLGDEQAGLLEFNEVLVKACEGVASRRYQSAEQMHADLALLQSGQSVKRHNAVKQRLTIAKRTSLAIASLAAAVGLLSLVHVQISRRGHPAAETTRSIAVLPFVYNSGDQQGSFLSESLAQELIRTLASIKGVKVAAPNSSFAFKDRTETRQEIGRQLKVGNLLQGTIEKSGDVLTIAAALINASNGERAWANTYHCRMDDLAGLESKIAQAVASALTVRLSGEQQPRFAAVPTQNPEAYNLFLQGSYWLHRWSENTIDRAVELLEKAVALDPKFAGAQAALAQAYVQKAFSLDTQPSWQAKASAAIQAALLADPNCAEAYLARGKFLWSPWNRFEHELAVKDLRRALELDPNLADAYQHLAMVYVHLGLFDQARAASRQALGLDPLNPGGLYREGVANLYEVATHLRGEAGDRQIEDAKVGLTHVIGLGSACAVHVLEKASI